MNATNPLRCIQKPFLFSAVFLFSFAGYTQNQYLDSLKRVLQTQKEDSNRVNTLIKLSFASFDERNFPNGIQFANFALGLSEKIGFKKGEAYAYRTLSQFYEAMYNSPEALKYRYRSLKLFEELRDTSGIGNTLMLIGKIHRLMKNYSEAEKYLFTALDLFEKSGNNDEMADVYSNIAQLYRSMGNYSQALKTDSAALIIDKQMGNQWSIAWTLASIGFSIEGLNSKLKPDGLQLKEGGYNEALKNYYSALDIFKKIGQSPHSYPVISMYLRIGNINIKLRNLKEARSYLEESLQLSTEANNIETLCSSYKNLSTLDSIEGNYKQAYLYYRKYLLYNDSLVNDEMIQKSLMYKMQYDYDKSEIIARAEQDKKDSEVRRSRNLQLFAIAVFLLLAIFFFISNRQKQRAKAKIEKAYTDLKTTQAQLIQSEKMASLGELTAGIAHEIQNPLNFVNNFSEVNDELLKELKAEAEKGNLDEVKAIAKDIEFNSEKINHHGKRADAIVKGMLQHSRANSGQNEPTDINALADEYLKLAYHGLRAKDKSFNAITKTAFDNSIGKINIMPQDIGRVILNLINNAFYAVDEKKKKNGGGYEPTVSVSTKKEKDKVEIKVKDNGDGIPKKVLDKIFQPFFTTKPTGQGTGLGLSLSYDIVKAHGGEITVNTNVGEYTEFILRLPF